MTIDWFTLIAAALVLWIPATLLYPPRARERLSELQSDRFKVDQFFLTWQHWADGIRAFAGGYFLLNYAVTYANTGDDRTGYYEMLAVHAVVLGIAVVLQTVHFRKVVYCVAPLTFVVGLTFALSDWQAALFASIFAAFSIKLGGIELKFPIMAVLLGIVGYFVSAEYLYLVLNCVLVIFPLVLTYIAGTMLVVYTRELGKA